MDEGGEVKNTSTITFHGHEKVQSQAMAPETNPVTSAKEFFARVVMAL